VLRERAENAPAGGSQKQLLAGSENARASSTGDSKAQREQPSPSTEGTVLKGQCCSTHFFMETQKYDGNTRAKNTWMETQKYEKYVEQQCKNTWNSNAKIRGTAMQKYVEQQCKNKEFLSFIKSQLCECKELRHDYVRSAALHACARSHRCHRDRRNCPTALSCATTMFRL
jgi:hypothetical protein